MVKQNIPGCRPTISFMDVIDVQVEYIGVGTRVQGTRPAPALRNSAGPLVAEGDGVTTAEMEKALRMVLSEEMKKTACSYRELLGTEEGVGVACAKISALLHSRN